MVTQLFTSVMLHWASSKATTNVMHICWKQQLHPEANPWLSDCVAMDGGECVRGKDTPHTATGWRTDVSVGEGKRQASKIVNPNIWSSMQDILHLVPW